MGETRAFHIGDILSITGHALVSPDGVGGMYNLLGWMVDEDLMTHQLPRVAEEVEPFLREAFPDLADIEYDGSVNDEATCTAYLARLALTHGTHRDVPRLPREDHTAIDPMAEIAMMRPDLPVIEVHLPPEASDQ